MAGACQLTRRGIEARACWPEITISGSACRSVYQLTLLGDARMRGGPRRTRSGNLSSDWDAKHQKHTPTIRREVDGITQKVLGQTLQRLDKNGLVTRHVVTSKPIAVEYTLSELGESLLPLVEQLKTWAILHEIDLSSARRRYEAQLGTT